ncbi:SLC45 family MFS transporter [Streptomyces sp. SID14478]|uniref:MFS transporter n=1 Tax=Streptomyces sp. SID14478 TaxID=2706073 RepID=UPI0013DD0704|nr:MFS transporter [Streptomyces sp. SID14478]NEB79833.1 SLC45 family MFS transporter [Streptomyces sp. SID14478]
MTRTELTGQARHFTPAVRLRRLLPLLLAAVAAMTAVFNGVQQVLVPTQVEALDPADKVGNLALLTTFAAVAALVGLPLGGALSDRTRSRFGRRTPWIVVLSGISGVLMIAMSQSAHLLLLGIVYALLWLAANMYQGALIAILPDRVPEERRGVASALVGLGTPVGVLIGVNVASRAGHFWGYAITAVVLVAASLALVLGVREGSSLAPATRRERLPAQRRGMRGFFEAFRSRDFTWAFVSRFALFLSYFTVSGYLYYTLTDYIGKDDVPGGDVGVAVSNLLTLTTVAWVVVATFLGWLADRIDRRKLFVGISALGLAATFCIPVISATWTGMVVYSVFLGIFIGTYFGVDLAVMSLVLPHHDRVGRDFGLLAVATGLPQIVSGALAGGLLTFFGGYTALYVFGIVTALISGITISFVKTVR